MSEMYIFVIDTDFYAGNFERECCAYLTGRIGECGVGGERAEEFLEEVEEGMASYFDEVILNIPDDHGCSRPCSIVPTPGWVNDGMGTHYKQGKDVPPTDEQQATYAKSWVDYKTPHVRSARLCYEKGIAGWTKEALDRVEQELVDCSNRKIDYWCDCFNSVGIYFCEKPSPEAITLMKERAKEFLSYKKINIEGFRLLKSETIVREIEL